MMINWGEQLQSKRIHNSHTTSQEKKNKQNERETEKPSTKCKPAHTLCCTAPLVVFTQELGCSVNLLSFEH